MKKIIFTFLVLASCFSLYSCNGCSGEKKHVLIKGRTTGLSEGTYDSALSNEDYFGWHVGKAKFKGEKPRYCMVVGTLYVFYNESCRRAGTNVNATVWEVNGNCCVIYGKPHDRAKNIIKVKNGTLQEQNAY